MAPAGMAPCVFFMPDRKAFFSLRSIGSMPSSSAASSTIISVADMVCSVPKPRIEPASTARDAIVATEKSLLGR